MRLLGKQEYRRQRTNERKKVTRKTNQALGAGEETSEIDSRDLRVR
jgi:hypothetical protein